MTTRAEVLELASEAEPILPSVAVVLREYAALLSSVEDGEGIVRELLEGEAAIFEEGFHSCADTMRRAAARITLDAQEKAALKGQADVLDALNTSQAHEISLLKAELASVKEVAHNNAERSNANYVAMQSALEFIDLTIERREAFAEYRAAPPKE